MPFCFSRICFLIKGYVASHLRSHSKGGILGDRPKSATLETDTPLSGQNGRQVRRLKSVTWQSDHWAAHVVDWWMDGQMDGWMDGWMERWIDGWRERKRMGLETRKVTKTSPLASFLCFQSIIVLLLSLSPSLQLENDWSLSFSATVPIMPTLPIYA